MPSIGLRGVVVLAGLSATLAAFASARPARAAPSASDLRAARTLFGHAEEDEDAGRWDDAMAKLSEVLRVKDTAGVRYHVALCEEHLSKLAAAWADYNVADQKARSEQAHDVLRLVGKKLADLDQRVPRLTVSVVPSTEDATLLIDGQPAPLGAATRVDPGAHEVEVVPATDRAPSTVSVSVEEGESKALEVSVATAAPGPAESPTVTPARAVPGQAPPPASHTGTFVAATGAAVLAAGGFAAFAAAGAAQEQAYRTCSQISAGVSSACDPYRVPVRAWDWVAVGAWTGAGVMATLAVISWVRTPAGPGRVVVGPASVQVEGAF
jgi:hypothetical protein